MKTFALFLLLVCTSFVAVSPNVVQITVYYESLCPYSRNFLIGSFKNAIYTSGFDEICNYTLVPYGNAQETQVGDHYEFTCQHGPDECQGNLIEVCALKHLPFNVNYKFVVCLEDQTDYAETWAEALQICADEFKVDLTKVNECVNNGEGNKLLHQAGVETDNLDPPHTYVPWILENGYPNYQDQIQSNMLQFVCSQQYGTPKQPPCDQFNDNQAHQPVIDVNSQRSNNKSFKSRVIDNFAHDEQ